MAQTNLLIFVLPVRWGLEATAALRALTNLAQPVLQAYDALTTVLLPALVKARGHGRLAFLVRGAALGLAGCGFAYYLVVAVYRAPVMAWMYAGRYDAYAWLVPVAGLLALTASVTAVFGTALRALEVPAKVFWA